MVFIASAVGIVLVCAVIAPFFVGPGGLLQEASSINSPAKLSALKEAILQRYLEDEAAFAEGNLSRLAWDKRRNFLANRYIDTARRLDYVEALHKTQSAARVGSGEEAP